MNSDRTSDTRDDPRRIALECVAYAWLRMPEVLDSWRKAALTNKAARRAWIREFGVRPEDTEPEDCLYREARKEKGPCNESGP